MNFGNWLATGILVFSLLLAFLVAASVTALTEVHRTQQWRIWAAGDKAMQRFEAQINSIRSTLVLLRLSSLLGAIAAAVILATRLSGDRWWAEVLGAILIGLLIILSETVARRQASKNAAATFRRSLGPLQLLNRMLAPVSRLLHLSPAGALPYAIAEPGEGDEWPQATGLEAIVALETPAQPEEDEKRMIRAIMELKETAVREVMVPRPDIVALATTASLRELANLMVTTGHSRIPVYEETLDHIVGVAYARDVLRVTLESAEEHEIRGLARPAHFVPEQKRAHALLREFTANAIHFAVVVDEYGGVEGVVTLEDLLEEIVGDIDQEMQPALAPLQVLNERELLAQGQVSLEELNKALGTNFLSEGFETVGGFVLHHLGRMARPGDRVKVGEHTFEVLATAGRRIARLRIHKPVPEGEVAKAG